jgi:hypothetical protein
MVDETEERSPESGEGNTGVEQDVQSQGGEGERNVETAPPIGQDAEAGQTTTPAPANEVGVPSDEEMAREEEPAHEDE